MFIIILKVLNPAQLHNLNKVSCSNNTFSCDLFFINNRNRTTNSVETHYFSVLNVKLQVKIRFKIFYCH